MLILIFSMLSFAGSIHVLYAQRARKIVKTADAAFNAKDYYQAAKLYAAALYDSPLVKSQPGKVYPYQSFQRRGKLKASEQIRATYQLAESYRLHNNSAAAMLQYKHYIDFRDGRFPLAQLWLGHTLLANADPINAQTAFNNFLKEYKKEDAYSSLARLGIASSVYAIKEQKESPKATVSKTMFTGSADGSNFALEKTNDSIVWFTSSRHEIVRKEKVYPVRLYTGNEVTGVTRKLSTAAEQELNMGASSLSADGLTLYFTGWKRDDRAKDEYQIYYMERSNITANWGKPVLLSAPVNNKGYQSKQPFITEDGQYLFFSSDQPGSIGDFDIWYVKMDGKIPTGSAMNAGVNVNTVREEVSPYYDTHDSTLYFSSDGLVGMGGSDIYKTKGLPAHNQWTGTSNLGHPINSGKNDLYYKKYKGSDTVFFSSDRNSSCCLEIFNALLIPFVPKVDTVLLKPVIQPKELIAPQPETLTLITKDTLQNVKFIPDSIEAMTTERLHINYNFASARIRNVDMGTLDAVVRQLKENPELNIMVASFTDCIGTREANINMSKKRSASVKAYLIRKGINPDRINTDYFAKRYFLLACKEDASYDQQKQIANRRSDLILTTQKNPQWVPSGKEIDADLTAKFLEPVKNEIKSGLKSVSSNSTSDILTNDKAGIKNRKENIRKTVERKKQENNDPPASRRFNLVKPSVTPTPDKKAAEVAKSSSVKSASERRVDIGALLEFVPKVKAATLVDEMKMRIPSKPLFVYTSSDSVRIDLFDNGTFDYDSLSVIYNKEIVVYKQLLRTTKPVTFYVKLSSDQSKNEMIFFAESLGITPPNSALMVITDGENKRTEVNISSDFNYNTVVYFIKVNK